MFPRLCFKYLTTIPPILAPNPGAWLKARHKGALWGRASGEGGWWQPARWGRSCFIPLTQPFGSPELSRGGGCRDGVASKGCLVVLFFLQSQKQKLESGNLGTYRSGSKAGPEGGAEVSAEHERGARPPGCHRGANPRSQTLGFLSVRRCTYLESANQSEKHGIPAQTNTNRVKGRRNLASPKFGSKRRCRKGITLAFCTHSFQVPLLLGMVPCGKRTFPGMAPPS